MEIIDNIKECPFCGTKFKVSKEDIKIAKVLSSVGYYHENIYKRIYCPICDEIVSEKFIGRNC